MKKFELLKTIETIEHFASLACEELRRNIDNYTIQDCKEIEEKASEMYCDIQYIAGDMCRLADNRHSLLFKQTREKKNKEDSNEKMD